MPLRVELSTSLRRFLPAYDPQRGLELDAGDGRPIGEIIAQLGIPAGEVALAMLNRRAASLEARAGDGDLLGLFPALGGG